MRSQSGTARHLQPHATLTRRRPQPRRDRSPGTEGNNNAHAFCFCFCFASFHAVAKKKSQRRGVHCTTPTRRPPPRAVSSAAEVTRAKRKAALPAASAEITPAAKPNAAHHVRSAVRFQSGDRTGTLREKPSRKKSSSNRRLCVPSRASRRRGARHARRLGGASIHLLCSTGGVSAVEPRT